MFFLFVSYFSTYSISCELRKEIERKKNRATAIFVSPSSTHPTHYLLSSFGFILLGCAGHSTNSILFILFPFQSWQWNRRENTSREWSTSFFIEKKTKKKNNEKIIKTIWRRLCIVRAQRVPGIEFWEFFVDFNGTNKMGTKSPGTPQRCRLILQHCLAIQLSRPGHTPEDFWMYDSGYMIFQVSICVWLERTMRWRAKHLGIWRNTLDFYIRLFRHILVLWFVFVIYPSTEAHEAMNKTRKLFV